MNTTEKRALQVFVAIGSLVPVAAGVAGLLKGPSMLESASAGSADFDSHFRYLSGLLLAIGLGFASTVPRIEAHGVRFQSLTCIVVIGGVGRLLSLLLIGPLSAATTAALVMELIVTPGLALWQRRVALLPRPTRAHEFSRKNSVGLACIESGLTIVPTQKNPRH